MQPEEGLRLSTAQPLKEHRIFLSRPAGVSTFPRRLDRLSRTFPHSQTSIAIPEGTAFHTEYTPVALCCQLKNARAQGVIPLASFHRVYTIGPQNYEGNSHALYKLCASCQDHACSRSAPALRRASTVSPIRY